MMRAAPLLTIALLGCSAGPSHSTPPSPTTTAGVSEPAEGGRAEGDRTEIGPFTPASDDALEALAAANDTFATRLYAELRSRDGNLALSPASVAVALGMTYAGARGETAAEMKRALALEAVPSPHAAYGTLLRSWQIDPKLPFSLEVANRLFAAERFTLTPAFVSLTGDHYLAPVEAVPFETAPDDARARINDWVADKTKQKIAPLLPPGSVDADTRLVLTNAVYFKGIWAATFDEATTRDAPFFGPGEELRVPTMHRKGGYDYAEVEGAKLLDMPYRGGRFAMTIALPDARDGLAALEAKLTRDALVGWIGALTRAEVEVALPRFTIDPPEPLALTEALEALGMTAAFDPKRADLRGMAEPPPGQNLFLSQVFHKAFVEVNEKGTEAAAATGVTVSVTSLPLPAPDPKTFVADHPFLFFIRDVERKSLLFMGRVVRPR